jgi:hypothetical protein
MSSDIDFKKLWQEQPAEIPSADAIYKKADQLKRSTRNKFIRGIIMLVCTMSFIIYVGISWDMKMVTTKVGIVIVLVAIALGIVAFSRVLYVVTEKNTDQSNSQYLEHLMKLKKEQERLHTIILSVYFALLAMGMFFYMLEPASVMNFTGKIIAYGLTGGWFVFSWFYLRRVSIKKQRSKLNEAIENLEKLKSQL